MDAQALGRYLRESREARELTLEDAERALHIRQRTLELFEIGEFTTTGASHPQLRGFVGNYARWLGLDEEKVLQYLEAALTDEPRQARRGRRKRGKEAESPAPVAAKRITDTNPSLPTVPLVEVMERRRRRRYQSLNRIMALVISMTALAVIAFVATQIVGQRNALPPATVGNISGLIAQQPTADITTFPTFTPLPAVLLAGQPTALPRLEQNFSGRGVLVTIQAVQRTWLSFASDGIVQFAGIMRPGDTLEYPAQDEIFVTASNAEALVVSWNGQPQGLFGGRGQKVDITFTTQEIRVQTGPGFEPTSAFTATAIPTSDIDVAALIEALTPTRTPGPSPTPSDTPTITLTPSITPTPSHTPTPSDTPTITPTPSTTPTPSDTPTITPTPTATYTPSITPSPTITPTPSPTAILPPRVTPEGLPPAKDGA